MAYSLGIRCLSEFIGMVMVIYMGEAALANELLPNTKGHAMGWGWTVFTFGFAFFAPLQAFAKVSAKLNPAMCLAQWVWGNLTGVDFVCLSLAELAGAFVGAVLVYIHFLPHFKTLPEPPAADRDEGLLRRRDHMRESALQIASYATKPDRLIHTNPLIPLRNTLYYLRRDDVIHEETPEQVLEEYYAANDPLKRRRSSLTKKNQAGGGSGSAAHPLARRTIQVADLQRHLQDAHVERVLRDRTCPMCTNTAAAAAALASADTGAAGGGDRSSSSNGGGSERAGGASAHNHHLHHRHESSRQPQDDCRLVMDASAADAAPSGSPSKSKGRTSSLEAVFGSGEVSAAKQRAQALYNAAVVADQNAKLSIFATRPAIYSPVYNFVTEAMGTAMLVLVALLIELQARRFTEGSDLKLFYEVGLQNLLICFAVVVCISGLGGPTGFAANTARDLGPRLAHALLPIPGKGRSEWAYAWVPALAPLVGGAAAGALYIALEAVQFPGSGSRGGGLFVG